MSSYIGYPSFRELRNVDNGTSRHISRARLAAYKGSAMHFIRTLYNSEFASEGFTVRNFARVPNPKYPGDEKYNEALAKAIQSQEYSFLNHMPPKFYNTTNTTKAKVSQFITVREGRKLFNIRNYLDIEYDGERPEDLYYGKHSSHVRIPNVQNSQLQLLQRDVEIFSDGSIATPDAVAFFGYMGWEKLADMLPFDYEPNAEK